MSELLDRYNSSKAPRPTEAKQIPERKTDFFDTTDQYQDGYTTFDKPLDPTKFSTLALKYFDFEKKSMVIPPNFVPTAEGIDLDRWTPENNYYTMGQPNN